MYLLRCSDGTYYCGYTTNLDRRLKEHNSPKSTTKYTRIRRPVELVYFESFSLLKDALRREYDIKQLSRKEKEKLIMG
jgi:putative endonuclease